ncbi:MAG: hypothetical protein K1X88_03865, partial [Nannocystaceae bacterium]|nr:hypothetical protein [Nannocystaceae bacterium]
AGEAAPLDTSGFAGRAPPVLGAGDVGTCDVAALREGVDALARDRVLWSPYEGRPFASAARIAALLWSACPEPPLVIAAALDHAAHEDVGAPQARPPDAVDRLLPGHHAVHVGNAWWQGPVAAATLRRLAAAGCPEYAPVLGRGEDIDWQIPEIGTTCGLGAYGFEPRERYDMRRMIAVVGWLRGRAVPLALAEPLADALENTTAGKLYQDDALAPGLLLPAVRSSWVTIARPFEANEPCDLEVGLHHLRIGEQRLELDVDAPEQSLDRAGQALDDLLVQAAARSGAASQLRVDRRVPTRVLRALATRARRFGVRTLAIEALGRFADLPVVHAELASRPEGPVVVTMQLAHDRMVATCANGVTLRAAIASTDPDTVHARMAALGERAPEFDCAGSIRISTTDDMPLETLLAISPVFELGEPLSPARRERSQDRGR